MTETEFHSQVPLVQQDVVRTASGEATCPFRHGPFTVDLLLAEVGARDSDLLNAVLDLRTAMSARGDAWALLEQLFRVRNLLQGRAYLAFYRVRCWVKSQIVAEVRGTRGMPWQQVEIPLNAGNLNEAVNTCLAALPDEECPGGQRWNGQVRFRFAQAAVVAS
jgi:hypothetical protein